VTTTVWGFTFTINKIKFEKDLILSGLNGLNNVTVDQFLVTQDKKGEVYITINGTLWNRSIMNIVPFGDITFNVYYKNTYIATAYGMNMSVVQGSNNLLVSGRLVPEVINHNVVAYDLVSRYLEGKPSNLTAIGVSDSISLYNGIVQGTELNATLNGVTQPLLITGIIDLSPIMLEDLLKYHKVIAPGRLYVYNPLDTSLTITELDLYVMYQGYVIGSSLTNQTSHGRPLNVIVPPKTKMWTDEVPITVDPTSSGADQALVEALVYLLNNSYVLLGPNGTVTASLGDVIVIPPYWQPENVPVCISLQSDYCKNVSSRSEQ